MISMTRIFLVTLLPTLIIACGALEDLRSPTGPEEQEQEVRPLLPEEARQELAELEIPYNQQAFIERAEAGDLTAVRLFVWAGMDPNVQPYTASAVYVALRDDPKRFSHLKYSWFSEGVEDNDTALMKTSIGGHLDVVQFLCENGADLRLKNQQRQYATHFAAAGGHLDIVEYLVDFAGYGVGLGDYPAMMAYDPMRDGPLTAIMWAAYGGHLDVVQYIHAHMKYNGVPFGWAGIYWASVGGNVNVIDWLIKEDGWARRKGVLGHCLMLAAYNNRPVAVGRLLAADADLHFRTSAWIDLNTADGVLYFKHVGFGPLHAAIQAGHPAILHTLLEHWMSTYGADGRDPHGMTALMYAAAGGDTEVARVLIDNGAPVNGASDIGVSALMFAAEWGHADIVAMLLEEGAEKGLVSAYDDSALTLAEGNGHSDVVAMLQ